MDGASLARLLGDTWFGWDLLPDVRDRLASCGRLVHLPAGAVLIQEARPCDILGVVVEGRVGLRLAVPGVADRTILTIEAGDVFGWSAVLSLPLSTSTCVASAETSAILFDRLPLRALLDADHEVAAAVYRRLLGAVARRLSATRMQLLDLYGVGEQAW